MIQGIEEEWDRKEKILNAERDFLLIVITLSRIEGSKCNRRSRIVLTKSGLENEFCAMDCLLFVRRNLQRRRRDELV